MILQDNAQPLVSVLIPAYNKPLYLKIALESVLNQTYKNIEIIICDDSTNDEVSKVLEPYLLRFKQIKYYNNGGPLGDFGVKNCKRCLSLSSGDYVNFLMDDDIFHPTKIERMMNYLKLYNNISMVTSHRPFIGAAGEYIGWNAATVRRYNTDTFLPGRQICKDVLINILNFIGEPTTVLFKKKFISDYGCFLGRQYKSVVDVAMWLTLLQNNDCIYISDPLSYFRLHSNRNGCDNRLYVHAGMDWLYLIEAGYNTGILTKNEFDITKIKWVNENMEVLTLVRNNIQYTEYLQYLKKLGLNCYYQR